MPLKTYLIVRPTEACLEIIRSRLRPPLKEENLEGWDAVLLLQGYVAELLEAVDIATKATKVKAAEIVGNCPQQFNTIALWGRVSEVKQALLVLKERRKVE
ncbi:MAG: BMC domain-containing protein [Synergistetes bacterium]|nr:MAG: Microcompartments protein [bacterium 42_11]MBC7332736.1 BMC domain-containing protein [Synergistota bacterium]MDK2870667.1 hypothetical protein [bacterium]